MCNHCIEDNEDDCNYTPKKRHKVPTENQGTTPKGDGSVTPYASKTASFLVSEVPSEHEGETPAESSTINGSGNAATSGGKPAFEAELRTEPQIKQYRPPGSPAPGNDTMDIDSSMFQQVGPDGSTTWVRKLALPPLGAKLVPPPPPLASGSGYPRPFVFDQAMIVTMPHIDPWSHPMFAPLPAVVLQTLATITAIEMPARHVFDESLIRFVGGLAPELRETATFIADVYADVVHAVAEGLVAELSPRLQLWATCHHARAGSRKQHLLILPRDAYFNMEAADEEGLRAAYVALTDGEPVPSKPEESATGPLATLDPLAVFDRVPVQSQIYDILVYTHRNHSSAPSMLAEARRIGIVCVPTLAYGLPLTVCATGNDHLAHGGDLHPAMSSLQDTRQEQQCPRCGRGRADAVSVPRVLTYLQEVIGYATTAHAAPRHILVYPYSICTTNIHARYQLASYGRFGIRALFTVHLLCSPCSRCYLLSHALMSRIQCRQL